MKDGDLREGYELVKGFRRRLVFNRKLDPGVRVAAVADLDAAMTSDENVGRAQREAALARLREAVKLDPEEVGAALEAIIERHGEREALRLKYRAEDEAGIAKGIAKHNADVAAHKLDRERALEVLRLAFQHTAPIVDRVTGRLDLRLLRDAFDLAAGLRAEVAPEFGLPRTAAVGEVLEALDAAGLAVFGGDATPVARACCGINGTLSMSPAVGADLREREVVRGYVQMLREELAARKVTAAASTAMKGAVR